EINTNAIPTRSASTTVTSELKANRKRLERVPAMSTEETDRQRNAEPLPQKAEQECAAPFQEQTAEITDPALSEGNPGAAIARTSKMERLQEEQEERRKQEEEVVQKARTEIEAETGERHEE